MPEDEQAIQAFFGAKFEYLTVTDQKLILFPKGSAPVTTKVKVSGLFNSSMKPVESLDKTQEGMYIPFHNNVTTLVGLPNEAKCMSSMSGLIRDLVSAKLLDKDTLFIVRKGGLAQIAKTKVKEIDTKFLIGQIKKMYTKADLVDCTRGSLLSGKTIHRLIKKFPDLSKAVQCDYPSWLVPLGDVTDGKNFIKNNYPMVRGLEPDYYIDRNVLVASINEEKKRFDTEFMFLSALNGYCTKDIYKEVELYLIYKSTKKRGKKNVKV